MKFLRIIGFEKRRNLSFYVINSIILTITVLTNTVFWCFIFLVMDMLVLLAHCQTKCCIVWSRMSVCMRSVFLCFLIGTLFHSVYCLYCSLSVWYKYLVLPWWTGCHVVISFLSSIWPSIVSVHLSVILVCPSHFSACLSRWLVYLRTLCTCIDFSCRCIKVMFNCSSVLVILNGVISLVQQWA